MAENCVRLLVKKERAIDLHFDRSLTARSISRRAAAGESGLLWLFLFEMRDVDVVIAATSSAETLLSCDDIENLMKHGAIDRLSYRFVCAAHIDPAWRGSKTSL